MYRGNGQDRGGRITTVPMTTQEKAVIDKSIKGTATRTEQQTASDICAKKCTVCFDGVACDLDCAQKNCGE
jgi:hypothetical protein